MEKPNVKKGNWIKIGDPNDHPQTDGYVFNILPNGELSVGYNQNDLKAIKEEVIWNGKFWAFKHLGPNGSYLRGAEEQIVKRGAFS